MRFTWNAAKAASNLAKHGVAFDAIDGFDWDEALVRADVRGDYGEVRLVALGPIGDRLHVVVFTIETRSVRLISLRRANRKEFDRYVSEA